MLNGLRIFTGDDVWRKILNDFGAVVVDQKNIADVNIDSMGLVMPVAPLELKSQILNEIEQSQQKIIKQVFKKTVQLPRLQSQIVVFLFKTGGMSVADLKQVLGYAPDATTHTIDTAIYQLRKIHGYDFIKNENGKYFIGQL